MMMIMMKMKIKYNKWLQLNYTWKLLNAICLLHEKSSFSLCVCVTLCLSIHTELCSVHVQLYVWIFPSWFFSLVLSICSKAKLIGSLIQLEWRVDNYFYVHQQFGYTRTQRNLTHTPKYIYNIICMHVIEMDGKKGILYTRFQVKVN